VVGGYANFDDERLTRLQDYDELVVALDGLYGNPAGFSLTKSRIFPGGSSW
jgi:hypothetical protein